jgi:beta-glucanase (GH16 family)
MNKPARSRPCARHAGRVSAFAFAATRLASILGIIAALAPSLHAQTPLGVPGTWTLTLDEEFTGSTLNKDVWRRGTHHEGIAGQGGNARENITLGSGLLTLTAEQRAVNYGGASFSFATGEISTFSDVIIGSAKKGFSQRYGYFEARMRWDQATGMWPAFWLMPDRGYYGPQSTGIASGQTEPWGGFERSYLKFATGAGSPSTVTSAILRVKIAAVQKTTKSNVVALGVTDDGWTETGITWNNMPAPEALWYDQSAGTPTAGTYIDFDVTAWVAPQAAAGDKTYSICLADTFMKDNRVTYHSREATNSADRPVLIINGTSYQADADAMVSAGSYSAINYGTTATLKIRDHYYNTANTGTDSYGQGMEVDIMETLGIWGSDMSSHALHWDGYGANHKAAGWGPVPALDTDLQYHVFGVYWEEGLLEFYVDGKKTGERIDTRVMNTPAYILLSLQLGGWDGNTPGAGVDGKTFDIDYVRVWSGTKSGGPAPTSTSRLADGSVILGTDYSGYSGNAAPQVAIDNDGRELVVNRDGWLKFPLSYTVTPDTVLEFTIDSVFVGEILAIGLEDNDVNSDNKRLFHLAGIQNWTNAWTDFKDYVAATGPKTYVIPIGAYYTGTMSYLAIANDNDAGGKQPYARYSNIKIHEGLQSVNFTAAEGYANGSLHGQPGASPAWQLVSGSGSFTVDLTKGLVVNVAQTATQNAVWQTPADFTATASRTAVLDFDFTQSAATSGTPTIVSLTDFYNATSGSTNVSAYFGRASGTDLYRIGFYQGNGSPATSVVTNVSAASLGLNSGAGDNTPVPLQLRYTLTRGASASDWSAVIELKNRSTGTTLGTVNVPAFTSSTTFYNDASLYPVITSGSVQSASLSELIITGYTAP